MQDSITYGTRVAAEIRAEFARRRRTGVEYAKHSGMGQAAVSRRLTGETPIDVAELVAMCAWLGVDPVALLARAIAPEAA